MVYTILLNLSGSNLIVLTKVVGQGYCQ